MHILTSLSKQFSLKLSFSFSYPLNSTCEDDKFKYKKRSKQTDIHAEQEKDTSGVEFHDEDPQVMKAIWILHQLLLLQAICIEQSDGYVLANLEAIGDASSTPLYLFS